VLARALVWAAGATAGGARGGRPLGALHSVTWLAAPIGAVGGGLVGRAVGVAGVLVVAGAVSLATAAMALTVAVPPPSRPRGSPHGGDPPATATRGRRGVSTVWDRSPRGESNP
ncbi:MAG: hypothetical protein ACRDZ9_05730, partial [Acidimicrobiales bacterium]